MRVNKNKSYPKNYIFNHTTALKPNTWKWNKMNGVYLTVKPSNFVVVDWNLLNPCNQILNPIHVYRHSSGVVLLTTNNMSGNSIIRSKVLKRMVHAAFCIGNEGIPRILQVSIVSGWFKIMATNHVNQLFIYRNIGERKIRDNLPPQRLKR